MRGLLILSLLMLAQLANCNSLSSQQHHFKRLGHSLSLVSKSQTQTSLLKRASAHVSYSISKRIPRNSKYFVEGLSFISQDVLLESTGLEGGSEIHYLNLKDMSISHSFKLPKEVFGEGSSMIYDKSTNQNVIFMMTYTERIVYKFDEQLTKILDQYELPHEMTEGWGMTVLDDSTILTTDGTNKIFHIDPSTFTVKNTVEVYDENMKPIQNLNEIEIIEGKAYLNIFFQNTIVEVNPHTGELVDSLDFTALVDDLESQPNLQGYTKGDNANNCLNGIAYNKDTKQLIITGKNWPYLYEVSFQNH